MHGNGGQQGALGVDADGRIEVARRLQFAGVEKTLLGVQRRLISEQVGTERYAPRE